MQPKVLLPDFATEDLLSPVLLASRTPEALEVLDERVFRFEREVRDVYDACAEYTIGYFKGHLLALAFSEIGSRFIERMLTRRVRPERWFDPVDEAYAVFVELCPFLGSCCKFDCSRRVVKCLLTGESSVIKEMIYEHLFFMSEQCNEVLCRDAFSDVMRTYLGRAFAETVVRNAPPRVVRWLLSSSASNLESLMAHDDFPQVLNLAKQRFGCNNVTYAMETISRNWLKTVRTSWGSNCVTRILNTRVYGSAVGKVKRSLVKAMTSDSQTLLCAVQNEYGSRAIFALVNRAKGPQLVLMYYALRPDLMRLAHHEHASPVFRRIVERMDRYEPGGLARLV